VTTVSGRTVDVLGDRVERDGGAEGEGALVVWRHECVVHNKNNPRLASVHNSGNSLDVNHLQQWVGGCLDPHKLGS
jgi:hypothetical protein